MKRKFAISPLRSEDYAEWYQQVIKASDLAENAPVRGCMVIKPWGYSLWETIQKELNDRIKALGHENAYFPLFIPLSFLEKEAAHVEGFAKECAIVTHHRLESKDGRLIPCGELEEPLVVRPTSETIIGTCFAKWIQSHRDLPVLINQWANVVRWEMRPRLFLRTVEFLWQEGHTAHANEKEARHETQQMLQMYTEFVENHLAIPVIPGTKTPSEKFPGAVDTYTIEAMMQDRKALQLATSHYLGQNFATSFGIKFSDASGEQQTAYTTSWGITTRLIGGVIMVHSDDDGLRLPPKVAAYHVVIVPFSTTGSKELVAAAAAGVAERLKEISWQEQKLRVHIDKRDMRGGEMSWHWIKRGVPLRIEIGMRDMENQLLTIARRDRDPKETERFAVQDLMEKIPEMLSEIQSAYFKQASEHVKSNTVDNIKDFASLQRYFTPKNHEKPEVHGGFVHAKWCGNAECESQLEELKVSIRCLPLQQSHADGKCVVCGLPAHLDAVYAKSY